MESTCDLIFSDLDGTLLDHYTYQWSDAQETIEQLKARQIPIILNTSKTKAELELIQQELALDAPFIIENGSAVFIPKSTFTHQPPGTEDIGEYWLKTFSMPRAYWLKMLDTQLAEFKACYQGFSSLSIEELCELTGLSPEKARQAKQREYGEPIHWTGGEESKARFVATLQRLGANVMHGGRFMHISDHCDKGLALQWLTSQYSEQHQSTAFRTIALGDGGNDTPMLDAADIAVQVKSPTHAFPKLTRQIGTIKTELHGPAGWSASIQTLLFNDYLPK